nr:MAG TPA: hypothetical protein [Caudoviricetes sp.]
MLLNPPNVLAHYIDSHTSYDVPIKTYFRLPERISYKFGSDSYLAIIFAL